MSPLGHGVWSFKCVFGFWLLEFCWGFLHLCSSVILACSEKTLESPLDCKKIQPVHSERDQPWDFFGRNDAKAETPVLWPPHAKSWLIGKTDAGRDWRQEEKGTTEVRWLDGITDSMDMSQWTPGDGDGQGGLACCDSWGRKESDATEQLNWPELKVRNSPLFLT